MSCAIVGQSGGPTAAINATLAGVIKGAANAHQIGKIDTLFGMKNGIEGLLKEDLISLNEYFFDDKALSYLSDTPGAALGSCRLKLPADKTEAIYDQIFAILQKYDIHYFFYIGGNDSMDTTAKLSQISKERGYPLYVIGVPKTIDNDLCGTDHTPGFGSAAKFISTVISEIMCDTAVYTKPAVTIVEIMGRDAGWLTASAALCADRAPDLIYLPEVPFSIPQFLEDVKAALKCRSDVVVAVSEGIRLQDGSYVGASTSSGVKDAFGHQYLGGAGKALEMLVKEEIGCKVRSVEINLPQRCAAHLASATDISESFAIGCAAVDYAIRQITGHMMVFIRKPSSQYEIEIGSLPVSEIANQVKAVPRHFINEKGNYPTPECIAYLTPLIQGERYITFVGGVPSFFRF